MLLSHACDWFQTSFETEVSHDSEVECLALAFQSSLQKHHCDLVVGRTAEPNVR